MGNWGVYICVFKSRIFQKSLLDSSSFREKRCKLVSSSPDIIQSRRVVRNGPPIWTRVNVCCPLNVLYDKEEQLFFLTDCEFISHPLPNDDATPAHRQSRKPGMHIQRDRWQSGPNGL